jgi:glycosyltransferase involved in cell wall biosynthesis
MLVDSLLAGGAERIAVEVATRIDRERFDPLVIATRHTGPLEEPLERAGVPRLFLGRRRGFSPGRLVHAHRAISGADLLHAHKFGSNVWGALLARSTRVPLVVREPTFSGVRTITRTLGYRLWIGPVARRIICPTPVVADSLEHDGIPRGRLRIIPNGVLLDASLPREGARAELGLEADGEVVGIVARLRPEKAHQVLFRAVSRLRVEHRDLRLVVVGDGPCRPALETAAQDLGIADRVVWAGERRDARRLISAFDVGVICSEWEGLPNAALETMAAGVPLVSTRVGTMADLLSGDAGVLVDVNDDAALADGIHRLLSHPGRAREVAGRARLRIEREHTMDAMVAAFEAVYDEVLGRAPAAAVRPGAAVGG